MLFRDNLPKVLYYKELIVFIASKVNIANKPKLYLHAVIKIVNIICIYYLFAHTPVLTALIKVKLF